jgi:2'-5' RNA ligase
VKEATRRLFFAFWPTAAERAEMAEAARACLAASGGRVVTESDLHVTLVFLGSVPGRRVDEVVAIAQGVAASGLAPPPLKFSFERLEYWKKPQVLCAVPVGLAGAHAAVALAAALKTDLVTAGFAPDLKPFQAHVTLARKVAKVPSPAALSPVRWSFEDYALVGSRTESRGSRYEALHRFTL